MSIPCDKLTGEVRQMAKLMEENCPWSLAPCMQGLEKGTVPLDVCF